MTQLVINNLSKTYRNGVQALNQLNLTIGTGMFGLLGPNGAGKSTLLRTIATLQSPDSGNITFGNIDALRQPMELRKVLGYLPQEFGVYPRVSAQRLLDYFATLKGISSKQERRQLIDRVLEITNLTSARQQHVSSYSGGMRQRFGIAQLLLNDPKLIIVDEPTAGLDPAERNRFLNILREISTASTVIFSTHIVEDVKELCTQMAILHQGRLLQQTTPHAAAEAMIGRIWTKAIDRSELIGAEAKYQVLSSRYNADNLIQIRIYSEDHPGVDFVETTPDLADVYFWALEGTVDTRSETQN